MSFSVLGGSLLRFQQLYQQLEGTNGPGNNEAYCCAAGTTHVINYRTTLYTAVPAVVKDITNGPLDIIYNAISTSELQTADWGILGPNRSLVLTLPPAAEILIEQKDGQWVVLMYSMAQGHGNEEFGMKMYAVLPGLLADGSIKVGCLSLCGLGRDLMSHSSVTFTSY